MGRVTDQERREAARRLRSLDDSELQVYDMTYFAIQRAVGGGGDQHPDGRELADRLADLIEPSPSCEFWDAEEQECCSVRTVRPVDRDALLALADSIEEAAACKGEYDRSTATGYARRIREACGVES